MQRKGIEGLCAVLIRLALPNRVPAVELVIGQLNMVTECDLAARRPHFHGMLELPIRLPAQVPVTIRKGP